MVIFWIFAAKSMFKPFFVIATAFMALALFFALQLSGKSETDKSKSRFYFRKKFTKYYMLEIFYGARKQVFFTFGPYVLILFYGANACTFERNVSPGVYLGAVGKCIRR